MNKKKFSFAFIFQGLAFLALLPMNFVFAQLRDWGQGQNVDIEQVAEGILGAVGYFFGVFAVIAFVTAGILFLSANGEPQKLGQAKSAVLWGFVGVVVGIIAFSIIGITQSLLGGGY